MCWLWLWGMFYKPSSWWERCIMLGLGAHNVLIQRLPLCLLQSNLSWLPVQSCRIFLMWFLRSCVAYRMNLASQCPDTDRCWVFQDSSWDYMREWRRSLNAHSVVSICYFCSFLKELPTPTGKLSLFWGITDKIDRLLKVDWSCRQVEGRLD